VAGVQILAQDGRTLGYELLGPHDGDRVVSIHGTPGSRIGRFPIGDPYTAAGVRLLKFDRPGYGLSTRLPGRSVGECASDVAAITDHLGWETFAVTGASGGGPHALSCGVLLRPRVSRVLVDASLAPFDARGLDWYADMATGNIREFQAAERSEQAVRAVVEREAEGILERLDGDPAELLGESYELADADLTAMSDEAVAREVRATLREGLRPGLDGWVDDDLAFVNPWGFDPQAMTVPVMVRYGAADTLVPAAHGRWLATHIPTAIEELDATGHLGSMDPNQTARQLRWLAGR
jgi:pimeloyl-ACP methyl ester carboxylesterase